MYPKTAVTLNYKEKLVNVLTEAATHKFNTNESATLKPVDANGKNGKAIDTDALTNESMPANPTKAGYTFKEWNTKADGKGDSFTGASIVNSDMTVYAIYTKDSVPTSDTTPTPNPEPNPPTPTPELKPQPEKHVGMISKTGESASFAGLLTALGFSIAGLAILRKKKMMEENK